VVGGYANQTGASYIQQNISYVGVSASYTFWGWGKRKHVLDQRQTDISMAHQSLAVAVDRVKSEARKAYIEFQQATEAMQLSGEMVEARVAVEKSAVGTAAFQAKGETAKAQLEQMKAELTFRIAHAKLAAAIGMQ
jgi:outer membrane protein TolC